VIPACCDIAGNDYDIAGKRTRPLPGVSAGQTKNQCSMSKLDRGCPILAAWNPAILVL
jgi:hypothetical protein